MIRYYESVGLIPAADRKTSGYRDYSSHDVHRLGFIRRARDLGFDMEQIRHLLRLWSDRDRSNAEVKTIALQHVAALKQRAKHLNELADALKHLAAACEGDGRPECPIIKDLEGQSPIESHCAAESHFGPKRAVKPARGEGAKKAEGGRSCLITKQYRDLLHEQA